MVDDDNSIDSNRRSLLGTIGFAGIAATAGIPATTAAGDGYGDDQTDGEPDTVADRPHYELPPLPYDYGALEPHIEERIMQLHHGEHHQGYIDGANEVLSRIKSMHEQDDFEGLRAAKRDFSFNLSGHVLHSIFWENMTPGGSGTPSGRLASAIDRRFNSFDSFVRHFGEAAGRVEGPGWATLAYDHAAETLLIMQTEKHNHFVVQASTPLLVLDVWEHAYYLQYENEREAYINEWWNVVNWDDVARRYEHAKDAALPVDQSQRGK